MTATASKPPVIDPPATARFWRCDGCGKGSAAKSRPSPHLRFVGDFDDVAEDERPFVAKIEPKFDRRDREPGEPPDSDLVWDERGERVLEVAWVRCGPFRRYNGQVDLSDFPKPLAPAEHVEREYGDPNDHGDPNDVPF